MTTDTHRALAITRVFEAPRDAVFRAWTDPALARTWWSPRGFTTVSCDMDARPGGAWRVRMRSPSGRTHDEGGVFREVQAPDRLVFTQVWVDPSGKPGIETLVTVTFAPHGATATKVHFEQSGFANAEACEGHEGGWSSCFDRQSTELASPTGADEQSRAIEESKLRALLESLTSAIRTKDPEQVVFHYAEGARMFDLPPPLVHSTEGMARGLADWFKTWTGPVGYEVRDLELVVGKDVAFGTGLHRMHGDRTNGEKTDVWVRATHGFRKLADAWVIAHAHLSVPFYMDGSQRAATDLKPE